MYVSLFSQYIETCVICTTYVNHTIYIVTMSRNKITLNCLIHANPKFNLQQKKRQYYHTTIPAYNPAQLFIDAAICKSKCCFIPPFLLRYCLK